MKIYTKAGDSGTTSLFGGKRVDKNSARIEAYGCVDELNSLIGVIVANINVILSEAKDLDSSQKAQNDNKKEFLKKLIRVQAELFVLGTDLATPTDVKVKIPRISKSFVTRLEKEIDLMEKQLSKLKNFILPGGTKIGSRLHLARTVARRAERRIVELSQAEKINKNSLIYINRLSDWLFVLARYVNYSEKAKEIQWKGRGR